MFVINNNVNNQIEIKKSKFITYLYKVTLKEEVLDLIAAAKDKHKDCTHCTYAYILEDTRKCSDDHEPSNTAGLPMLEVLEKNDLINTLVITIRYFGGIKLGAGGLIRAYAKSVTEALKLVEKKEYIKYEIFQICTSYENKNLLSKLIPDDFVIKKEFKEDIVYTLKIKSDEEEKLLKTLDEHDIRVI